MNNTTKVLQLMLEAFDELKSQNKAIEINKYDDNLILFGAGATIDSLTLVSLIVDLESKISEEFSYDISLTDDRAMTREISPFDTFGSLKSYIAELVNEIK